jgi:hypothetical protein
MIGGFIDDRQYCRKNNIHSVNENNGARMTNQAAGNEKRGSARSDCRRGGYVTPPHRTRQAPTGSFAALVGTIVRKNIWKQLHRYRNGSLIKKYLIVKYSIVNLATLHLNRFDSVADSSAFTAVVARAARHL